MFLKYKNIIKYSIISFLTLSLITFLIVFSLFYYSGIDSFKNEINIQKGDSLDDVIFKLSLDESSKFKLKLVMKVLSLDDDIKPGKHNLKNITSVKSLVDEITASPRITITILEGWSLKDIADYLDKNNDLNSINTVKFLRLCNDQNFISTQLKSINSDHVTSLEGYLYPDTYRVDPYIGERALIKVFISEFLNKTKGYHHKIDNKVMIVASIIEAETDLISEMDTISSIYNNRIEKKMRLESDPTVLFYMKDSDLKKFKNRSTSKARRASANVWRKYKDMDNPYNTYKNYMPPGPINCPRIEAIEAALAPASTDYLYMVMSGHLGRHLFSNDYGAHSRKVKRN